jgi:glyoxylase-like metal-dependent hydrolase (beta-lactamase superfamily II)/ferredoxin
MANPCKRLPSNAPGDFYVDATCINCGNCRALAPGIFGDEGRFAFVKTQPREAAGRRDALRALLACPTASIGGPAGAAAEVTRDFPLLIEDGVYYCGFNSPKSYGAASYFIRHPGGNWLVDAPRFIPFLVEKFESLGGLKYIFLTHRDDVGDADKFSRHFGAARLIHEGDQDAMPDAETIVRGLDPLRPADDILVIPTPGHTRGHSVLLYKNKFLFTGDHLEWDPGHNRLGAWPDFNWYSWREQTKSMDQLLHYDFEWVLPGHGHRVHRPAGELKALLRELVDRMAQNQV